MTPDQKAMIVAAYEAEERREGGLAFADVKACMARAAAVMGVSFGDVQAALREHLAGNMGKG